MRTTRQLSITLPIEMADMVQAKVASGSYASESEVIRDGLRVLADRDAVIERWLREQVLPSYDALMEDPARAIPADRVLAEAQAILDARKKDRG
ncbi:MAG: type II toxin-antitoxin system ParD family antitoxin [Proteobacteria bacterium]|nr:type II toxin-antitoxin system ParD family antitoxin [Pseudomonadota bacterium]